MGTRTRRSQADRVDARRPRSAVPRDRRDLGRKPSPPRRFPPEHAAVGGAVGPAGLYPGAVRVVSLLPSATEIVYALGIGGDLVGVTFECDEPPAARSEKTVVVGGRDTSEMTNREIDSYVRAQLAAG